MSNNTNTLFWVITGAVVVLGIFLLTNNTSNGTIENINSKFSSYAEDVISDPVLKEYYGHVLNYNDLEITDESLFTFNASTQTITRYNGSDTEIVFPYEINGVEVKKIGNLNIHNTVLMAERCERYVELAELYPDEYHYTSQVQRMKQMGIIVDGVCQERKKLTKVVLPNTITEIGSAAFMSNEELTDVVLPPSIEKIDIQAFQSCNLTKLELEKLPNLKFIGTYAFDSNNITGTVVIPASVTYLSYHVFGFNDITHGVVEADLDELPLYTFRGNPNMIDVTFKHPDMSIREIIDGNEYTFEQDSDFIVYVPTGSRSWYSQFPALQRYNIIEKDM